MHAEAGVRQSNTWDAFFLIKSQSAYESPDCHQICKLAHCSFCQRGYYHWGNCATCMMDCFGKQSFPAIPDLHWNTALQLQSSAAEGALWLCSCLRNDHMKQEAQLRTEDATVRLSHGQLLVLKKMVLWGLWRWEGRKRPDSLPTGTYQVWLEGVTVNFMCQPDWAMVAGYLVKRYSGCFFKSVLEWN